MPFLELNPVVRVGAPSPHDLSELPIEVIDSGRYQPRRLMPTDKLEELAASIRAQGIVQPIVVQGTKLDVTS